MNYCTRCASYYMQPGTCNCYAPVVTSGSGTMLPVVPQSNPDSSAQPSVTPGVRITSGSVAGSDGGVPFGPFEPFE